MLPCENCLRLLEESYLAYEDVEKLHCKVRTYRSYCVACDLHFTKKRNTVNASRTFTEDK